ncbi:hypothetical protein Y1Q_0007672 [Alligator mississippiensis]|uniref:Uncharacterized protein n=1 Tax=Alligator mississippiensis TaxID=8496 RepID=A0A151LY64_ALLMI|nr:hypothetical protein Y1Q_0007672 [Alligator mississippiensis]
MLPCLCHFCCSRTPSLEHKIIRGAQGKSFQSSRNHGEVLPQQGANLEDQSPCLPELSPGVARRRAWQCFVLDD